MRLATGTRLGPYEITGSLGAGGMGEVYRARDSKLGRTVALKILPDIFADHPERVARFEREARTLASLNHPHIAQVYGFEQSTAGSAIVMELVEGEDLASRLARGPIPFDEALPIARQIAHALEAAHDLGIVHRDLKPANIKLTPDGTVKVLDFGLAKAIDEGTPADGRPDPLTSPTITSDQMTIRGVILGTAAYMSPEQARGRTVDRRADIWAFGVVLYEMLSGRQAFAAETVSDTIAAVLTREPDLAALPRDTGAGVRYTLARCLRKDPAQRFHHIADARLELEHAAEAGPATAEAAMIRAHRGWIAAPAIALFAVALAAAAWWGLASRAPELRRHSFTIPGAGFSGVSYSAISPDGCWMAYAPNTHAAPFRLFLRSLDGFDSREIAASETTALSPFFSADSQWLGFFQGVSLYKVAISGGVPERLGDVLPGTAEGAWAESGTIVAAASFRVDGAVRRPLMRVSARGGTFEQVTRPSPGEAHHDPHVLPGGEMVLFTVATPKSSVIAAVGLSGGTPTTLLADARRPRYSGDGHLVFQRASSGDLMTVPRGLDRLESEFSSPVFGQGRPRVSAALRKNAPSEAEPLGGLRQGLVRSSLPTACCGRSTSTAVREHESRSRATITTRSGARTAS